MCVCVCVCVCVCRNGSQEGRGARAVACSMHAGEEEQVEEDHRWRRESGTEPGGGLGAGLGAEHKRL